jgi:hypothetical protein
MNVLVLTMLDSDPHNRRSCQWTIITTFVLFCTVHNKEVNTYNDCRSTKLFKLAAISRCSLTV